MSKMKLRATTGAALGLVLAAGIAVTALAHEHAAGEVQKKRHDYMKALGGHMKGIADVVKGEAAYSEETAKHAEALAAASTELLSHFPEGSGGEKTRAKPEIWSDWAGFEKAAKAFEEKAPLLVAATQSDDTAAIGAALEAVGGTCGGCHKPYRVPK